jgi:hypothetical protein
VKKMLIIIVFIQIGLTSSSQKIIQKWTVAIKAGAGIGLNYNPLPHVEMGAQLEYRNSEIFSWVGNTDFAKNFEMDYGDNSFSQLSISTGPRFYIKNSVFIGTGAGYSYTFFKYSKDYINGALILNEEYSSGSLLLNTYLGVDTKKLQFAIDYKANIRIDESYISLIVTYKFGKTH